MSEDIGYDIPMVTGNIPHDSAEESSSLPVLIGGKASTSTPAAVTAGDRCQLWVDLNGAPVVQLRGSLAAHDDTDSGNPLKIGAKAVEVNVAPTAVAAGDRSDAVCDRHGQIYVNPSHRNTKFLFTKYTTSNSAATLVSADANGVHVVTALSLSLGKEVTAGNVDAIVATGSTEQAGGNFGPGGGIVEGGMGAELFRTAKNEAIKITNDAPTGGTLYVRLTYYTIETAS